jgi:hypothetical protein
MNMKLSLVILAAVTTLAACGPATFTRTRTEYAPMSAGEFRQEKDGVIVELRPGTQLPPNFFANVPRCDQLGRVIVDRNGQPYMDQVSLARPSQIWQEMAITNHTDHVLRMNGVAIRLFDPSGGQFEALTRDDMAALLYNERPCFSTQQAGAVFRSVKIFDRNIEVVPGTTSTFWVPFLPAAKNMTGVWKFSVYEVPSKVDSTGRPTKTTQFHMRLVAKEITETLHRDGPGAQPRVISTTETSPVVAPEPPPVTKQNTPAAAPSPAKKKTAPKTNTQPVQ